MDEEGLLIRETQKLPQVTEMNKHQILILKKLETFQILKEAFKIPFKNPRFIILTFLTSFPLFFIMLLHETILQKTITETKEFLNTPHIMSFSDESLMSFSNESLISVSDGFSFSNESLMSFSNESLMSFSNESLISVSDGFSFSNESLISVSDDFSYSMFPTEYLKPIRYLQTMSPRFLQLGFLYMVPFHFLDLINTISTIDSSSMIYRVDRTMGIKEMLLRPIEETRFMGPLFASLYIMSLNLLILSGLLWAVTNSVVVSIESFVFFYVMGSIIATVKWLDWSALWNMGMVFSVLEERDGLQALGAATYYSRGNRTRGFHLMLIFFVLRNGLRFMCVHLGGHERLDAVVATSVLSCVLNVMKWVVFMVYYCDCKKRVMEKKVDVEEGRNVVDAANMGST